MQAAPLNYLTLNAVIAQQEPELKEVDPPCFVQQQQDDESTKKCSGSGDIMKQFLVFLGVVSPDSADDDYSFKTNVSIKPKNAYTSLNVSLSYGGLSEPKYNSNLVEKRTAVSESDFETVSSGYRINARSLINLVESDNIVSFKWANHPVDNDNNEINPPPPGKIIDDEYILFDCVAYGVLIIKILEMTIDYKLSIDPRMNVESDFYSSYIIVDDEGCSGRPFFFKVNVPACLLNSRFSAMTDYANIVSRLGGGGGDMEHVGDGSRPPDPPAGNEQYSCEYCECTMNLLSESIPGVCSGVGDVKDSVACITSPKHNDCKG